MANEPNQGWSSPVAGLESLGGMVGNAVESYERTLNLVQSWFEGLLATYKEQADSYGAMLRSVDTSLSRPRGGGRRPGQDHQGTG